MVYLCVNIIFQVTGIQNDNHMIVNCWLLFLYRWYLKKNCNFFKYYFYLRLYFFDVHIVGLLLWFVQWGEQLTFLMSVTLGLSICWVACLQLKIGTVPTSARYIFMTYFWCTKNNHCLMTIVINAVFLEKKSRNC